jgi:NAD(P)-dependent dehydrogenase (short-subunit alcohol dehydrogenase family)
MPIALITGASRGFGRALADELGARGWRLVVDARGSEDLHRAAAGWNATVIPGDVNEEAHRASLAEAVGSGRTLDLLVNNASTLGASPLPALEEYPIGELERAFRTNVLAPLALTQLVLQQLAAAAGAVVNITSDAAVEAYLGWGGYGASKAALDQVSAVLAAERPDIRVYAFDPGDMRTAMHQEAFPGEDIGDRAEPATIVPALLRLVGERPPSGRYRAVDLLVSA